MIPLSVLFEGYLISDKTISIDLHKFESEETDKLFVIGLSGSGKTTLGKHLAKKYKVPFYELDLCGLKPKNLRDQCRRKIILNKERCVVEGAQIVMKMKPEEFKDASMIIVGKSLVLSTYHAATRNNTNPKATLFYFIKFNINRVIKKLDEFRKYRISVPGTIVKEFKIPRLI